MSDEIKTVEIPEKEQPEVIKTETLTREQAKEKGWSQAEMDAAEKRGMVLDPEAAKKADEKSKAESEKADAEKKAKEMEEASKKGGDSSLPDFEIKDPAKEKVFLDTFGPGTPQRAMYFRMKNERSARQRAEAERDRIALELQTHKDEESRRTKGDVEQEMDADGNPIDPEDKPLTMKQLREMQKREREEMAIRDREMNSRANVVSKALVEQEEYAKATLPDFEDTVKLATDLVNHPEKLEDPRMTSKLKKLVKDLQVTAANADKYGPDDYTASMIAYEVGQMHPDYGKKSETNGDVKTDPKANGGLTPEQMKRIEENTHRRASSASLPGSTGSNRVIAIEDVTVKDLLKMSAEGRYDFKKKHPEKYAKLMRG